ncbi:unnamed protein product, partial [Coregonus sp. 'balchen']
EGLTGLLTTNHKRTIECYGDQGEFSSKEQHVLDNEGRAVLTRHRGEKIILYDLSHDFLYFQKYSESLDTFCRFHPTRSKAFTC